MTWIVAQVVLAFSFGENRSSFFYAAIATLLFLISNVLVLSSLNDTKMMEEGIGRLKDVSEVEYSDKQNLDDII